MKNICLLVVALLSVGQAVGKDEAKTTKSSVVVAVDPQEKYLNISMGAATSQIPLVIPQDLSVEGKPLYFGGGEFGLVSVPMGGDGNATTIYYAVDNKGKKLWTLDLGTFNAATPLIEKDFVYFSGTGKVMKVDKKSGKVAWAHEQLFKNKKYEFDGAETIDRKDNLIIFSPKVHVNDQTGKLAEVKL